MNQVDEINAAAYADSRVVNWYGNLDFISKPEQAILEKVRPLIKDEKLLDIGIGGGRTTKYLLEISRDYTGIDYSAPFVEFAKKKYPVVRILRCDARDLSVFADHSFAFVQFSLNGIDYMDHDDRIKTLKEIHRVLQTGGLFMFSTHNRDYKYFGKLPWQECIKLNPSFLKSSLYTLYHLPRHIRLKLRETHTSEYAIINDTAHGFALLTYYINMSEQRRQLEAAGFTDVEAWDMDGNITRANNSSPWFHYLARRA